MPELLRAVHPVLMARDVSESLDFFARLGFTVEFRDDPVAPRYGVVRRGAVELHLQWADAGQWAHAGDRPAYRFLTSDVDAMYAEARDAGIVADVSETPFASPADTPWGTREFHVRDPGDNSLQFYALLATAEAPNAGDVNAFWDAGRRARATGNLSESATQYAAALEHARASGNTLRVAHIARHLGDIFRESSLPDRAEPLLQEALMLYRTNRLTRVLDLANAVRPLALLYGSLGRRDDAKMLWQEARALYTAIGVSEGAAECDSMLSAADA